MQVHIHVDQRSINVDQHLKSPESSTADWREKKSHRLEGTSGVKLCFGCILSFYYEAASVQMLFYELKNHLLQAPYDTEKSISFRMAGLRNRCRHKHLLSRIQKLQSEYSTVLIWNHSNSETSKVGVPLVLNWR